MIPAPFCYLAPSSASEAVAMLEAGPNRLVLAGGQTLVNALKLNLVQPTAVVDVHGLPELRGVRRDGDGMWIGAATTYAELAADPTAAAMLPEIGAMAASLVDRQVRNRGTMGGNCALNDPTSNFPPLLAVLGARFEVLSGDGARTLTADEFFLGTMMTAVSGRGLLTGIRVDPLPSGSAVAHRSLALAADSWSLARAAVRLDAPDGRVTGCAARLGSVADSPFPLPAVEQACVGLAPGQELVEAALAAFDGESVTPTPDTHGSAEYRLAMARVQLKRALTDASKELTR